MSSLSSRIATAVLGNTGLAQSSFGTGIAAGYVGELLSNTNATSGVSGTAISLTLTAGVWLCFAQISISSNASETDGTFTWVVEGSAAGTEAKGVVSSGGAAAANWSVNMPMRPIVVNPSDGTKTVAVTWSLSGSRTVNGFCEAVRIA